MSRLRLVSGVVLMAVLTAPLLLAAAPLAAAPQPLVSHAVAAPATGGVLFIENAGQWPAGARFQVWGGPTTLWLAQDAIWLTVIERGDDDDMAYDIAVDATGRATITGETRSTSFPATPGSFQPGHSGGTCGGGSYLYPCSDAFVVRLNAAGSALEYGTFLGGSYDDIAASIAIDTAGRAYISGAMQRGSSSNASACQYVASNVAGTGDAVTFSFTAPYDDEYYLWARGRGLDWTHNSFWVRVDGGEDVRFEIEPDLNGNWVFRWQAVSSMTLSQQPFSLGTGAHTLRFQAREPRAQLDAVYLVNRANVVPTQVTPCSVTWRTYLPSVRR